MPITQTVMGETDCKYRKVIDAEELRRRREAAREAGRAVVQCHGCFDIVHPGHIRHLQQAAKLGDILLVTVTGDAAMAKGAGRPLIPEELRAENLAALDCVDWVYLDPNPTARELLDRVRPDIYVKGTEYEHSDDPRLLQEREAVERHGGRVVYSSGDIIFSSTALIAALQDSVDPLHRRVRELVDKHNISPEGLSGVFGAFRGRRISVVGQSIIDTYIMCDRPDVAGESPMMSLRPIERRSYDGGAAILARHLAAMGARPILITGLPRTPEAEAMRQRLLAEGIETRAVEVGRPLAEKQRFLVGAQKVMKLDLVEFDPLDAGRKQELINLSAAAARESDAMIVADFGRDLITPGMMSTLCEQVRAHTEILAGDVSGRRSSLREMRQMDLICPSESEARDAMGDYDDGLSSVVYRLLEATRSRGAMITLAEDGLIAFDRVSHERGGRAWSGRIAGEHVPALASHALDPLGCGDALVAAATLTLAAGGSYGLAAVIGSIAAAEEARRLGNLPISVSDMRRAAGRLSQAQLVYDGGAPDRPALTAGA